MGTLSYAGSARSAPVARSTSNHPVAVDPEGFLLDPSQWTEQMASDIDANLFFTFFGLDAVSRAKHDHVRVATVGNPALHLATWAGGIPGISALVTHRLAEEMEKLDIPPIPEFIELIADSGAGLYACQASVDLFGLGIQDFVPQVQDIITVGEFYGLAAGGQIIFT